MSQETTVLSEVTSFADHFDEALVRSQVFNRLGFSTRTRELIDAANYHPAKARFTLSPSAERQIVIDLHYRHDFEHFAVIEIRNTKTNAEFRLDEWLSYHGLPANGPLYVSGYAGNFAERVQGFVSFLESQFSTKSLDDLLLGYCWECIPYDRER